MNSTYTDEEIERCTISGRNEIIFHLRELIRHGGRIAVSFDEGRNGFLTILVDVSEVDGILYFDIGGSTEINSAFLHAKRYLFSAVTDGIRIQFSTAQAVEMSYGDQQVFAVRLPKSLLRLQRRNLFRISLPGSKPCLCRIRRGTPGERALQIHDISIGGIGIVSNEPLEFEAGDVLENCAIDLRDSGMLLVSLEVRHVNARELRAGKQVWNMGCQFVNLSGSYEALIQRLMVRVESERRALLPG